ncbi:PREDICTED: auxin-responsive IAA14 [Prunus dulcis]|uniref:PREDICTED: auxin-responsive IAA14 n=1 Tax=Prunus dulcis TaxID=3755 RepID=A0A5E4G7W4_PRUDU|nr:PREDICTED: auxin-responsive IAA14 [Prunus dulcis]
MAASAVSSKMPNMLGVERDLNLKETELCLGLSGDAAHHGSLLSQQHHYRSHSTCNLSLWHSEPSNSQALETDVSTHPTSADRSSPKTGTLST